MRKPDAGVAGGALDHGAAGAQFAALDRAFHDGARGAILDRAARIHELRLAEDLAAGLVTQALKTDERRVADRPDKAAHAAHARAPAALGCASRVSASAAATAATSPTMSSAGGSIACVRARAAMSASVPRRMRCCGSVARSMIATGCAGTCTGGAQPRHDARQLRDAHVKDDRVLRVGEEAPVGRIIGVGVAGDERNALGEAAMRERQAARGRGTERGRDTRHDGVGNAVRLQHLELFTAAAENEGVTALQSRDALAAAGELNEQRVDALLLAALAGFLADEDALRVAARALEHRLADQPVIKDHVRLLQQLQRPQGEQIRIPGAGADQIHLPERCRFFGRRSGELRGAQLATQGRGGGVLLARQHLRGHRAAHDALPERTASCGGEGAFYTLAIAPHEAGQVAQARRQQRLDLLAYRARQHRGVAGGADRDNKRGAIDDGGEDEGRELRIIHDVHRDAARARRHRDRSVDHCIIGGGHCSHRRLKMRRAKRRRFVGQFGIDGVARKVCMQLRRHHTHARAGLEQPLCLAQGDLAPADDDDVPGLHTQKYRQVVHVRA